ncbi:hypothetical protein SMA75_20185 [Escherichia coli]|uniref:hypothetical protein n=1 Tax=Escherichia coli TaxID=562 RepID=UPI00307A6822
MRSSVETFFRAVFPYTAAHFTGFALGKAAIAVFRRQTNEEPKKVGTSDGRNFRAQYELEWLHRNAGKIIEQAKEQRERKTRRKDRRSGGAETASAE